MADSVYIQNHDKNNPIQMNKHIKYTLIVIGSLSVGFAISSGFNDKTSQIKIHWIDNLKGDFNFRTKWSYPEGVYRNKYGQLDCDGFCIEGIELMKDSEGKIYPDSLMRFYQLVDTTHQYHSILCEAFCYEWAGTDFISVKQTNKNQIICSTQANVGTHCSLIFEINNDNCIPRIELNGIASPGLKTYYGKGGFIKIDKDFWEKGILKAEFNFDFNNTDEPNRKMFWKGRIYKTFIGNIFSRQLHRMCGVGGPAVAFDPSQQENKWTNNTWGAKRKQCLAGDPVDGDIVSTPSVQ